MALSDQQQQTLLKHLKTHEEALIDSQANEPSMERFAKPAVIQGLYQTILDLDDGTRKLSPVERANFEFSAESMESNQKIKGVTIRLLDGIQQVRGHLQPESDFDTLFTGVSGG